jgi:hypothetical protein
MVAAAIIGGAAIAATGTAVAGSEAAGATKSAAQTAATEQQNALTQEQQMAAPYTGLGTTALPQYEALLGIGSGANSATTLAALQKTPGYQFTQQQGEQGILNAASAQGGVSGNTLTALDQYNTGLADQTYQNQVSDVGNAVTLGQAAAAGQAANVQTGASNLGNIAIGQGNNLAAIDSATAAGLANTASSGINSYATLSTLQALNAQNNPANVNYTSQYSPGGGSGGDVDFISDFYVPTYRKRAA